MGRPSKYPVEFREQAVELVKANVANFSRVLFGLGAGSLRFQYTRY